MKSRLIPAAAALMVASLAGVSSAQIVSTGGAAVKIVMPANLKHTHLTSPTNIYAMEEKQHVLVTNLPVDDTGLLGPTGLDLLHPATPGLITDWVSSNLLHTDMEPGSAVFDGWVRFRDEIIAVNYLNPNLTISNPILGNPGVLYDAGFQAIEPFADTYLISLDRHTIFFHSSNLGGVDEIRVLTHTPEGSSIAMMALGALPLVYGIRRRIRKA